MLITPPNISTVKPRLSHLSFHKKILSKKRFFLGFYSGFTP